MKILTLQRNIIHFLIKYTSQSPHSPDTGLFVIRLAQNTHFNYIILDIFLADLKA